MSELAIVGYCRSCGAALDETTVHNAQGAIYCAAHAPIEHTPEQASMEHTPGETGAVNPPVPSAPPPFPSTIEARPMNQSAGNYAAGNHTTATQSVYPSAGSGGHNSPALAFLLGWIPGVGAVYNGQYAKGLVHVLILGSLISILSNGAANGFEPLFGLLLAAFFFYMAFEAYHTAKKREEGQPVDEFSSLFPMRAGAGSRFPIVAALLIVFGILFLLSNLDLLEIHRLVRYWPIVLILLGAYMLYERFAEGKIDGGRE